MPSVGHLHITLDATIRSAFGERHHEGPFSTTSNAPMDPQSRYLQSELGTIHKAQHFNKICE